MPIRSKKFILWFKEVSSKDVALVGGKNASLGEMFSKLSRQEGINIPNGFALSAKAYWHFIDNNDLKKKIKNILNGLNINDVRNLQSRGREIRKMILNAKFPQDLKKQVRNAYQKLCQEYGENTDVAVRSSATAEDLPSASFAGQHETYLNVRGEENLIEACQKCLASLFTDRAISYREKGGFEHLKVALSVGVQKMIRSDRASAGVIFTLDTETGFRDVVLITGSWGIGEMIVQGKVIPDEFFIFKPTLKQGYKSLIVKNLGTKKRKLIYGEGVGLRQISVPLRERKNFCLSEKEILTLAQWAVRIEEHYKTPMDIEWAKDGRTNRLYIVQARPETVHVRQIKTTFREYTLKEKNPKVLIKGMAIGEKIVSGKVRTIKNIKGIRTLQKGEILVTEMTDPNWEPIMKKSSGIITDSGGRTSHAAIVSRELSVPCIVGTGRASVILKTGQLVTMDCSSGEVGKVYQGDVKWQKKEYSLNKLPKIKTKIMINIGTPENAFRNSFLPHQGVGLVREEFIIASKVKVHPLALISQGKGQYFVDELARGVGQIAAAFWPYPVIVRFSDFKTNEYAALGGGENFEPKEENPMLGFRGAARYLDKEFQPAFRMECQAIKKCREVFGLKNISVMVPFCRTPEEGKAVVNLIKKFGLEEVKIYVMAEIPSNVILADKFLDIFDGMSIGSNDLTQLVLGIDRDNAKISYIGNEQNEAVKHVVKKVIEICKKRKKYIGICGEAPSNFPDFAEFLVEQGIESISLNPDTVIKTILLLSKKEKQLKG